ncbi:MAG: adenylate/guanylate cyclase domain-containing protein, partial [Burkholderiaceae bacterium]
MGVKSGTTFVFTDIEASTRIWEREPLRMPEALACHDALARVTVERFGGRVVKMIGDGMHAVFDDPISAIQAAVEFLVLLSDPARTNQVPLKIRCGVHSGIPEERDDDFFGAVVNRAARICKAAHGGQILVSEAVANLTLGLLPSEITLLDLGVMRLRYIASAERIYQVARQGLRDVFPPPRNLETVPNNLPHRLSSFVGRRKDSEKVIELINESRLVTLFGAGGIGKTRLAVHIGNDALAQFPDGVWIVELAPIRSPAGVEEALAGVLGVVADESTTLIETLIAHVRDRRMLIILDNCEHLLEACAQLAKELLLYGNPTKLLATSRVPLAIEGEIVFSVAALAIPDEKSANHPEGLLAFDSVRLFVDRALSLEQGFRVSEKNAKAVQTICRRLDGIPLALELAAGRIGVLSVQGIAERLDDRFRLLAGGDRTALPRQQTLRALIDWS